MTNKKSNNSVQRENICSSNLFKKNKKEYGTEYRDHFFELYKIAIQGVDYTSNWKHTMNNYFLTIHSILLAALGISVVKVQVSAPALIHQIVPILGIFMAIAWLMSIRNYNNILEVKFLILHSIEEHLPIALYATEWELLKASTKTPDNASRIDIFIPVVFSILYILILFFVN